jgi:hypothetical protein
MSNTLLFHYAIASDHALHVVRCCNALSDLHKQLHKCTRCRSNSPGKYERLMLEAEARRQAVRDARLEQLSGWVLRSGLECMLPQ